MTETQRLSPRDLIVRIAGYAALIFGGLFPLAWIFLTSFKTSTELQQFPIRYPPESWSLTNYRMVFTEQPFALFFMNSMIVSSVSTVLCVIIAALAAYALARLNVRRRGLFMIAVVTFSMFPVISLLVPLFKIMRGAELLNTYPALILPYVALSLPIAILVLTAFFASIPRDLESAAMVDGCSRLGAMWRVVVPLSAPGMVTAALLVFVNSWNEFLLALSLMSRPSMRTVAVGVTLYQGEYAFPWPLISAALIIAVIPIVALIVIFQRRFVSGLTAGGVKA